ncbi:MAG: NUMOD4 motif-containing HNH endonuclease [Eggerthellaceae bacterium]|nr:NUMOD4 motif-containing HNH endonuclease [Eggerthellaceae bacterium]
MQIVDVPGFEARYAVSDDGRIWSKYMGRWLRPSINHSGYLKVGLMGDDGQRKKLFVHRLVCEAFHGAAPGADYQVDHINACHTDNRAENLRWVSGDENLLFAAEKGIGRRRRPIVGFNAEGDVVRFRSISHARKNGFSAVRRTLQDHSVLCRGYAFVYAEEYDESLPGRFFKKDEVSSIGGAAEPKVAGL